MNKKQQKKWFAAVFAGAACAGLLVGLWLSRNASFHREQKCEKLYDDAWKFFAKKKIEDGALALNVLFTSSASCEKAPDAGYYSGVVKEFYTHELPQARQIFRTVMDRYPGTAAAEKAREKLSVYEEDKFQWYREKAQGTKLTDSSNADDALPDIFHAYKDNVKQAILHLQFLREGKRILHDTDAEQTYAYLKAVLLKAEGKYGSAKDILVNLAGQKTLSPLQQRAQLHLADVFFRVKKYNDALDVLDKVSDAQLALYVDYSRGEIYFAQQKVNIAADNYESSFMRMALKGKDYNPASLSLLFSGMDVGLRLMQCQFLLGEISKIINVSPESLYSGFLRLKEKTELSFYEKKLLPRKIALSAFLTAASYEAQGKTKQAADMYENVLKLEKPEGDPDNIFPSALFSAGKLYFNAGKCARAITLFSQFEKEYGSDENVSGAQAYRFLCEETSGGNIPASLLEPLIEKVKDGNVSARLYYALVRKQQSPQKDALASARELAEEEQAKRLAGIVIGKLSSVKTRTAYEDIILGDLSYYRGDVEKALMYFKSALQNKNNEQFRRAFGVIRTFSTKPETVAAYLKKCLLREKITSLEKQIEKEDSSALHAKLAAAYADIGWAESAFSQWRQAMLLDAQSYVPQYKKDMEEFLADVARTADAAVKKTAAPDEDAALDASDAAELLWKIFYRETLLKIGLGARFPAQKNELEKIITQNGSIRGDVWASLQTEKTFYIPPTDALRDFQSQVISALQLFLNEQNITAGQAGDLKFKCEELLAQLQEAEG